MFNVPWIGKWDVITGGEPKAAWAAHLSHHEWSLLARGELVHSFAVEDASEHAVAHLECPLMDETLVVLGDAHNGASSSFL
jgi:hypothetical protein